mgnify:CR=1 FL=1
MKMRRLLILLLAFMMVLPAFDAEAAKKLYETSTELVPAPEAVEPIVLPLGEDGFLRAGEESPYVLQDPEGGRWAYLSEDLRIEIVRYEEKTYPLCWFETHIYTRNDRRFQSILVRPDSPGRGMTKPVDIARDNNCVLAFSDDFIGFRYVEKKERKGLIIRGGRLYSDTPYRTASKAQPNYDVLAYYPDGSMKAFLNGETTGEALLAEGVTDAWCFGPVLVSGGELSQIMVEDGYHLPQPRQALGMIEPGHYMLLTVKGRVKNSAGVPMRWLALYMKEHGVVEALNLDGGNTIALVFMGELLTEKRAGENSNTIRSMSGMIGIGEWIFASEEE